MAPVFYMDGNRKIPLSECSLDQCEKLYDTVYDKVLAAASVSSSGVPALQHLLEEIQSRIDMFYSGLIKKPEAKRTSYSALRVEEDEDPSSAI